MTVKKEVTLGNILTGIIFVVGAIGASYSLKADVDDIKSHQDEYVKTETFVEFKENFNELRNDVREIRDVVTAYVAKNPGFEPAPSHSSNPAIGQSGAKRNKTGNNANPQN